ncbi:meiosis-specific protein PAIR3 isoform X1 [Typha angustifolia]|uniref:meiosis-specific protein PAIR3 isoform X1 n=1 Tax=Typha angustifolia TaxID=59011 RepID=UPI003C2C219D
MMEVEWQKVHKAASSDCRSLGSNQYPSGRFPKVSIGVTVEKCPKMGYGMRVEDGCAMPTSERKFLQGRVLEENKSCVIVESTEERQKETKDQKASLCLSTRYVHHETPTAETLHVISNRASVIQSEDHICKKVDTVSFRNAREKGENSGQVEEAAFTSVQEMMAPDRGACREQPSGITKHDNRALRMKLWEILGTASQTKQAVNAIDYEDTRISDQHKCQVGRLPKDKHYSDPIETDSESPNQVERRPVTRSSTRKKIPTVTIQKMQYKKTLSSFSLAHKQKLEEKNIFAFEDGEQKAVSLGKTADGNFSSFKGKRIEHKKTKVKPRRIHFPMKLTSEKSLQNIEREENKSSPDKASSRSKEEGCSPCLPRQSEKGNSQTSKEVPNVSIHSKGETQEQLNGSPLACAAGTHGYAFSPSPAKQTPMWEHEKSPCLRNDAPWKKVSSPSIARYRNSPDDFQSPTFAMNANASSQRSKLRDEVSYSPRVPKSLDSSKSGSYASDADTESSDDTREIHVSREIVEEKETEKQPFLSPMEDQETQTFEANEFFKEGYRRSTNWFSDVDSPYTSNLTLHHIKRVPSLKDESTSKINMSSSSPIDNSCAEEITGSDIALEQFPENSLRRAIYQLAVVLERFKTKIKSQTSKKSSDILSAAAEKIQLQLQDAESQMQADVTKLISTGKSKRRRIESKFQEQEEKLRIVHDKFKEDVNQHLLACKSMLEELEGQQIDLMGNADKQKASHGKFLLHVKESVETHLSEAETKIADIHKEARKKMNGMKRVLKEWMAEGPS